MYQFYTENYLSFYAVKLQSCSELDPGHPSSILLAGLGEKSD